MSHKRITPQDLMAKKSADTCILDVRTPAEIKTTHMATINKIDELFPGRVALGHLSGLGTKPQWRWSLDTNGTKEFLKLVMPYLITKKREAEIAIKMCDRSGAGNLDALAAELKAARA